MKPVWVGLLAALAAVAGGDDSKVKLATSRGEIAAGEKLFAVHCGRCHGAHGEGSRGPALTRAKLSRAPDDAALVNVIENGIHGTEMPGAGSMSHREVLQTAAFVRSLGKIPAKPVPGNPTRGAELYRGKGGCDSCHTINGEGGIAGPNLSEAGSSRSATYLREALVDPQAAVPEGYLLVTVTPKNGAPVTGVRANEDSFSVQVRTDSGQFHSFRKSDIASIDRQRGKSAMPSYQGRFTADELTDLVAYLASLKEKK